jgi:hypothetical protein
VRRGVSTIRCPQCKRLVPIQNNYIKRAEKNGLKLFCGRKCSGLARRKHIPLAVKKQRKKEYDVIYRARNLERIRRNKAAYYQRTFDREKEREYRKRTMARHVEYCRRPEYKAYKHEYDLRFRAQKLFGPFADAALILRDVEIELDRRMTWVERHQANGTLNKSTQRKRQYAIRTGTPYPR